MYAKIFEQILDSSIAEDWKTRHVFEDFIKLSDPNGVVDMTREAIARRTKVPLKIVREAILELESPDPNSRNPTHGGRRIVRIDEHRDWGWIIVNYDYYRNLVSEDQRREKTRLRVQKWRQNHHVTPCNAPVTPSSACNAMQREKQKQMEGEGQNIPHLTVAGRIAYEKELERIGAERSKLGELKDYPNISQKYKRLAELMARQNELRKLLGVVA